MAELRPPQNGMCLIARARFVVIVQLFGQK
jgi:hypothetical protein